MKAEPQHGPSTFPAGARELNKRPSTAPEGSQEVPGLAPDKPQIVPRESADLPSERPILKNISISLNFENMQNSNRNKTEFKPK